MEITMKSFLRSLGVCVVLCGFIVKVHGAAATVQALQSGTVNLSVSNLVVHGSFGLGTNTITGDTNSPSAPLWNGSAWPGGGGSVWTDFTTYIAPTGGSNNFTIRLDGSGIGGLGATNFGFAIGDGAMPNPPSPSWSIAIGQNAGAAFTTGGDMTFIGSGAAGNGIVNGLDSIIMAVDGGHAVVSANGLIEIGQDGFTHTVNATNSVVIGHKADTAATDLDNAIIIGANAVGGGNNSVTIGNTNNDMFARSAVGDSSSAVAYKQWAPNLADPGAKIVSWGTTNDQASIGPDGTFYIGTNSFQMSGTNIIVNGVTR